MWGTVVCHAVGKTRAFRPASACFATCVTTTALSRGPAVVVVIAIVSIIIIILFVIIATATRRTFTNSNILAYAYFYTLVSQGAGETGGLWRNMSGCWMLQTRTTHLPCREISWQCRHKMALRIWICNDEHFHCSKRGHLARPACERERETTHPMTSNKVNLRR